MCARGACLVYSLIGTLMCDLGRDKVGGEEYQYSSQGARACIRCQESIPDLSCGSQ